MILQIKPDPTTDKLRKRRSSRTAGLTREKESGPTTLWFRPSDEGGYTLQDWARYISSLIQPSGSEAYPMSPITPASPTFSNPFSPRRESGRPGSGGQEPARPAMQHHRSRPHTFSSDSPSLRSRKSDISSHGSSLNAMGMGYVIHGNQYTTVLPTDLPSPATTVGELPSEYTLGWTNAQGRSSTLSSPVRARGSVSSQGHAPGSQSSSSPPPARESILDRAFQLRCIPGVETEIPGEYNLSSLARFDALMREAEERRKKERAQNPPITPMTSTFEEDEDAEEQDTAKVAKQIKREEAEEASEEDNEEEEDEEESSDDDVFEHHISRDRSSIGPSAQRALAFIANRHSSMVQTGRATQSYHPDSGYSILRPHTAHSRMRPSAPSRGGSQPHIPLAAAAMENQRASMRDHLSRHEKRHSTSSVKRLSFNEFTKRLSSTSSLLLTPNGGGPGSRGSSESESTQQPASRAGLHHPRGTPSQSSQSSRDSERCGWRGSVGVFGAGEGSFI
ncbi:hypothetical protein PG991_014246 [Apiospora marii]|uniref:Uncharacterized protein n=2 Tax=Apiospora marii TaxID=335849 RepID=A0ABR1RA83_9PEZI